jgi:nickel-dependent lactate racemase
MNMRADMRTTISNQTTITIPFGDNTLSAEVPATQLAFTGELPQSHPLDNFEDVLEERLNTPVGCPPLNQMVAPGDKVLILIDDNTRHTPVHRILPILIDYLHRNSVGAGDVEILTAPGTHRMMTADELKEKVGLKIYGQVKLNQHNFNDASALVDLGEISVGNCRIPIHVNRKAVTADFIIGLGNIVPHCDAGFSAGAKILQPGICGYATTAATHITAALSEEIPLGNLNNPCRLGMEKVAAKVGLKFIINTVMTPENDVMDIVAGDFIEAHRVGCETAKKIYGVQVPAPADIVVVSSSPCDIDYWQAEKGLVAAYFAVKKGGTIILAAPCPEGLEHNHPQFREWLQRSFDENCRIASGISPEDETADLISADLAICHARAREKAKILVISDGLDTESCRILGFTPFKSLQAAVDSARADCPEGTIGILPRGGDCLPLVATMDHLG